jgi:glutamate-5-semialdehyde dehydrogenase
VTQTADLAALRAHVEDCGRAAAAAAPTLATAGDDALDAALRALADRLEARAGTLLDANRGDVERATGQLSGAVLDRLRLDEARLADIAAQVRELAGAAHAPRSLGVVSELDGGLVVEERRIPVGVIGANYEARANVTVDVASQLVKSRNAGVLRTGGAALETAIAMADEAIGPALAEAGLPPAAIQVVRRPDRDAARALVSLPHVIPLVILRGSGPTTAALGREAAEHGVRTLAHAEGGGVLFVHAAADRRRALALVESSLDRLGVCNRLNLLLVDRPLWDALVPEVCALVEALGVRPSLPPHDHRLGHEWATDDERSATVTIAPADGPADAAAIANRETSGLAAGIATEDAAAAAEFLDRYRGTGAFWNATTRLLDGFRMLRAPETGINVDQVPGPRGPVTYQDLQLRQYVVRPA